MVRDVSSLTPEQWQVLLNGPSIMPPPGVKPNFDQVTATTVVFRTVVVLCTIIATMAMVLRMYVTTRLMKKVNLEDWLLLAGWFTYVPWLGTMSYVLMFYPGYHMWDLKVKELNYVQMLIYVGITIGVFTMLFVKTAIILQMLRVFVSPGSKNAVYWSLQLALWIGGVAYVITSLIDRFSCNPVGEYWNTFRAPGACKDTNVVKILTSLINVVTDLVIFIAPQWVIWTLMISDWRKRLRLALVFAFGLIAIGCSCFKLYYTINLGRSNDQSWWFSHFALMANLEIMAGFVIMALPLLPKFATSIKETWSSKGTKRLNSTELSDVSGINKTTSVTLSPSERYLMTNDSDQDLKAIRNPGKTHATSMV